MGRREREYPAGEGVVRPLTPSEFQEIRRLAHQEFGLDLRQGKEELVAARLGSNIREANCRSFREYCELVHADRTGEALIGMIDALTTNHTGFLREPAHFDFLRDQVLPLLVDRPRMEVWSAACSTGEEPYTIALTMMDRLPTEEHGRVNVLATDISTRALDRARRAIYPAERFTEFPAAWMRGFLLRGEGRWQGWYRFRPEVTRQVEFQRLNLVENFPHSRRFPLIFCRNVMIYFDKLTQEKLVGRLADCLEPGGYLFVGHAESLTGIQHPLRYVQPAIYMKPGTAPAGRTGGRR